MMRTVYLDIVKYLSLLLSPYYLVHFTRRRNDVGGARVAYWEAGSTLIEGTSSRTSRRGFDSMHLFVVVNVILDYQILILVLVIIRHFSRIVAAMTALTEDGKMYTWGAKGSGGGDLHELPEHKVRSVYSTIGAFTIITEEGLVDSWGYSGYGGNKPTSLVRAQAISSTKYAFAALTEEGTIEAWGDYHYGGIAPSGLTNVRIIFSNNYAFAALKNDGTWCLGRSRIEAVCLMVFYTGVPPILPM